MAHGKYEYWITQEGLLLLESWARDGATDEQIAHNIGISRETLYQWKKKYPDISDTLKRGKEIIDVKVENALLKRALGYSYTEKKYLSVPMDPQEYEEKLREYINTYKLEHPEATLDEIMLARENFPKTKEQLVEKKEKEVVPDTTAQIFWLKNRRPDKWKDRQEMRISGALETEMTKLDDIIQQMRGDG